MEQENPKNFSKSSFFRTKIGLALGGGGARGIAHIGVLKAFEEHHVRLHCISGTSVGAFIATLFAFGKSATEIEAIFTSLSFRKLSSFSPEKLGFISNNRVERIVIRELGDVYIQDAKIPLAIICTDLISGEKKIFTEGPAALLVQASSSFPGIYSPVAYQNMLLVDGALTENIPVSAARSLGANFIVAVSLSDQKIHVSAPNGVFDVVSRCFDIVVDQASTHPLKEADYTIKLNLTFMSRFKIFEPERAMQIAYASALKMFSKPLIYWWMKPFLDYAWHILMETKHLLEILLRHPKIRAPSFLIKLKEKVLD